MWSSGFALALPLVAWGFWAFAAWVAASDVAAAVVFGAARAAAMANAAITATVGVRLMFFQSERWACAR